MKTETQTSIIIHVYISLLHMLSAVPHFSVLFSVAVLQCTCPGNPTGGFACINLYLGASSIAAAALNWRNRVWAVLAKTCTSLAVGLEGTRLEHTTSSSRSALQSTRRAPVQSNVAPLIAKVRVVRQNPACTDLQAAIHSVSLPSLPGTDRV
jgi:hypothetical protein